ncbi:MAG: sigma-E processing peptidase SpoIIGA [Defluviitaleaceae bacterium]|nr:sigma-E processing peptidase SpoIIGA [Defluviitaleaceae bacterium]
MIIDVYADVVFLVNFGINTVVMVLVNALGRRAAKLWRLGLGGAFSALLYVLLLFSPLRWMLNEFTSFAILAPGVVVAFSFGGWRRFLINLGLAYISAFALGGLVLVIMNLTGGQGLSTANFATVHATPLNLAVAAALSLVMVKFAKRYIADKALDKQIFCCISVIVGEQAVQFRALVDTGMTLTEPIGQNPVIISEVGAIAHILPKAIRNLFLQGLQDDLEAVTKAFGEAGWQSKFRLIPFRAIGQQNGVMLGFRPDMVKVDGEMVQSAIVAICDFDLSINDEYGGLINPMLYNKKQEAQNAENSKKNYT